MKAILLAFAALIGSSTLLAADKALGSASIYQLDHRWTNQDGAVNALKDLQGRPAVVAMIFTSCKATCPFIVSEIKALDTQLTKTDKRGFQYILFSIDPARDTAAALKAFAKKMKLDNRWTLLTSNADQVREIAAVLGYGYKAQSGGDFTHSTVLVLLSAEGEVIATKDSNIQTAEFVSKMKKAIHDGTKKK
jgi:protein SCO1/2